MIISDAVVASAGMLLTLLLLSLVCHCYCQSPTLLLSLPSCEPPPLLTSSWGQVLAGSRDTWKANIKCNNYVQNTFCSDLSLQTTINPNGTKASLTHPPPAED
jgi:hypothetical protein